MKFPSLYFNWLQKDNPVGTVDKLPELTPDNETSVAGIFCIGDLTGIPLIKLAAESGYNIMKLIQNDVKFKKEREENSDSDIYDLVIVGAGPAGISAAIEAEKTGYSYLIIESSRTYNTIVNFPKGKPIHVSPAEMPTRSELTFTDGTKESLLKEMYTAIENMSLKINQGEMVQNVIQKQKSFSVKTSKASYSALRVIIAIGKSGNARMLNVPGEELPKVFTRLIDPAGHTGQDVLVVGGGDTAIEAANALAQAGARVNLSYRKPTLSRPKEQNLDTFNQLTKDKKITPLFESSVSKITEKEVVIKTKKENITIPNDAVFGLIGSEIPFQFFKRSNIRMEGEKNVSEYLKFAGLLLFASLLYFGKKAPVTSISLSEFFTLPGLLLKKEWPYMLNGMLAWISFIGMIGSGLYIIGHYIKNASRYFTSPWNNFKYFYFAVIGFLFSYLYISWNLAGKKLLNYETGYWYTAMYSLTIVIFGLRRMYIKPTGYVKRQTISLMIIQVIPLFILPIYILPWLGNNGFLGDWVMSNIFPGNSYWRSYGLILAWPLFIHNLAIGQPVIFWFVLSILQTFIIIPLLNIKWGKGAYCGWICSCGALAETLGDEYRTKAPHGPIAKKIDNTGQIILWFAICITLMVIAKTWFGVNFSILKPAKQVYDIFIDVFLAGVLGVGVYFFMSGRVWCRFFCPLAALMHIYTRFSLYRIFADKKRCISCNTCTKVCHMGIDVMGYANKGIPMNDVECVRCSTCITECPIQVLTFGNTSGFDPKNKEYKKKKHPLQSGWKSGLPEKDIAMLLEQ